jgi:peroxiredoxin/YHS domain-containing protein
MKFLFSLLAAIAIVAFPAVRSLAEAGRELCLVCAVKEGATEPEPVQASRTYQGKTYGFCSETCAKEFEADPAAYLPPALPRPAPAFSVVDLDGRTHSNATLAGKVVLLDFWATWCAPCHKAMPELQALQQRYGERGLTVLGVSVDEGAGATAKVKKFLKSRKLRYTIAVDSGTSPAWAAFRVKAVPAAFLIDREGRLVAQWVGRAASGSEVEKALEGLLAAK